VLVTILSNKHWEGTIISKKQQNKPALSAPLGPAGVLRRIANKVLDGLRTLRFKLFLSYVLIGVLPLFVLWMIISDTIEDHLLSERLIELRSRTNQTAIDLNRVGYMDDVDVRYAHNTTLNDASISFAANIFVLDENAMVIHETQEQMGIGTAWALPIITAALDGMLSHSIDDAQHGVLIQYAAPVMDDEGGVVGAVLLAHTMTDADDITSSIGTSILGLIAVIGAVVALIVFVMSAWLLGPLNNVIAAVKRMSQGNLSQRVALRRRDEVTALGDAVNDMAQKLEHTESVRQEFVSNVSHELKTPLSSIKVLSESLLLKENVPAELYKEFLGDIDSEVDRMTHIIDELLTLVRLDEVELPLNMATFNLNNMVGDMVRRVQPLAQTRDIVIDFSTQVQASIVGDEMRLGLAISNLIENAVKYSHTGESVKVTLEADARNAFITVTDTGVGIHEDDHDKIFTRFYRTDKGRDRLTGGTGLGLAITHKTVMLHKGSIKLSSKLGEGSIFTVSLPKEMRG